MGKYQKNIEAARRISVVQYLETYHPGELVRKTDKEYRTKTHSSLVITPANGLFHWYAQSVGGNNAIDYAEIAKYNAFVLGVHDYYCMATKVSRDFRGLAFSVQKSQKTRFQQRLKTAAEVEKNRIPCHITDVIKERYGKSKQLRYVRGIALAPIGYVKHRHPVQRKRGVNSYTAEGRAMIHKQLEAVDMEILHYLMRTPVWNASIEYNDNRLSLYLAQMGKCAVTGAKLMIGDIFCHHKVPRCNGGTGAYQNLVLVCGNAHKLIHATDPDTIARITGSLNLTPKQKTKV